MRQDKLQLVGKQKRKVIPSCGTALEWRGSSTAVRSLRRVANDFANAFISRVSHSHGATCLVLRAWVGLNIWEL